jgi:hypothetical protein
MTACSGKTEQAFSLAGKLKISSYLAVDNALGRE